jgi:hypothetical protein
METESQRRVAVVVVVTGMGCSRRSATTWRARGTPCSAGRSGAAPSRSSTHDRLRRPLRREVKDFEVEEYLERKEAKRMDRFAQFAMAASQEAVRRRAWPDRPANVDFDRVGVIIGSGIGGIATFEEQTRVMVERGPKRISPFFVPMFIPTSRRVTSRCATACAGRTTARSRRARRVRTRRRRVPHHPARRGGRDGGGRHGSDGDAADDRRLREHEGAVDAQRLAGDGEPSVRRDARRLRAGRGRGHAGAGGAGARAGARRRDPRRGGGLRPERRRVPPDGAGAGRCGCAAGDPAALRTPASRRDATWTTSTRTARPRR